ncbi:hypothetical protein PGT21_020071 [Puccinia graminis f. sp. tritici]|uniref:Uncharacterized protein n=1 Tax=Puccinia graminis f. sp. tritici TaxID=56615 RepID=A0A5B0NNZ5_PUCGR|nr:hypothetical protein PGT21_020071 [Puccinia graminis f. sp. tritici]KAA1125571.1 hypothetical protein PGTUg99_020344 [Puccinia graminis f. sp. tritici]
MAHRPPAISWDTDGVNNGPSSMTILLTWLGTNNNYVRWRSAASKCALCHEILAEMRLQGIHHRNIHSIRLRMTLLEGSYNQAYEWECTTGGFMTAISVDGYTRVSVREHLLRMCKYWDELGPIMRPEEGEDY